MIAESLGSLPEAIDGNLQTDPTMLVQVGDQDVRLKPDFISVTRGPGMSAALSTGLDTAKGLALAWRIPLVGVHHMQAHALTPRLVHALESPGLKSAEPAFPFMSLLVSGGHTLLVQSESLCDHKVLASTVDIAVGDALDKIARLVLPHEALRGKEIMYGRLLEWFAFHGRARRYLYRPPKDRAEEIAPRETKWGWALPVPLADTKNMQFSFSGLGSAIKRICESRSEKMSEAERIDLAVEGMRVAFEHIATRVIRGVSGAQATNQGIQSLVISGGVASNGFLRMIMRSFLDGRGFENVPLVLPPAELCTDNAAMIAWAGMEMFEEGWTTDLSARALRKWSLDPKPDNGILGAPGWKRQG